MRYKYYIGVCIFILFSTLYGNDKKFIVKNSIAFINNIPKYIYIEKDEVVELRLTKNFIKSQKSNYLKAVSLTLESNTLFATDGKRIDDHYELIIDKEIEYKFKIVQDKMYLSRDGKEWDELKIKLNNSNQKKQVAPILAIVYLECKWFKGEYKLLGIPDA